MRILEIILINERVLIILGDIMVFWVYCQSLDQSKPLTDLWIILGDIMVFWVSLESSSVTAINRYVTSKEFNYGEWLEYANDLRLFWLILDVVVSSDNQGSLISRYNRNGEEGSQRIHNQLNNRKSQIGLFFLIHTSNQLLKLI